ncbi:antibiotic biosynthesis monooxygenase family protein [Nocardia callitridis]|uniref:Antibiotic biosynthesis monooxygenase n=1 Tax=Nocardia callitridis TaxID=648753 RepID=A0ABP9KAS9_9NOCA
MTIPVGHTPAVTDEPVTLINAFSVPFAQKERFLMRWKSNARLMAAAPGFVGARMMQSLNENAEFTFVNVAEWSSGSALDAARTDPEWQRSVQRLIDDEELDAVAHPMVYKAALHVVPGDPLP